jgi:hypothetical protein
MNPDQLSARSDAQHRTEAASVATTPEFCFSWCPVSGCASLCGDAPERPAAGAQRSEHRQRGAMASNTTPFSAKLALGQPNAPAWCEDE